jgi:hypothetical protein
VSGTLTVEVVRFLLWHYTVSSGMW